MANKDFNINPTVLAYVIGGGIAYFGVIKPTLEKLGVLDNADVKANKYAETNENAWKPTFWKQAPAGSLLLSSQAVDKFAELIYHSFGVFWDEYDTVMGVFTQLKTKSQVSYFADKFQQKTGKGLYQFIAGGNGGVLPWDGLSSAHLATINKYVSQLPNYKA